MKETMYSMKRQFASIVLLVLLLFVSGCQKEEVEEKVATRDLDLYTVELGESWKDDGSTKSNEAKNYYFVDEGSNLIGFSYANLSFVGIDGNKETLEDVLERYGDAFPEEKEEVKLGDKEGYVFEGESTEEGKTSITYIFKPENLIEFGFLEVDNEEIEEGKKAIESMLESAKKKEETGEIWIEATTFLIPQNWSSSQIYQLDDNKIIGVDLKDNERNDRFSFQYHDYSYLSLSDEEILELYVERVGGEILDTETIGNREYSVIYSTPLKSKVYFSYDAPIATLFLFKENEDFEPSEEDVEIMSTLKVFVEDFVPLPDV